MFIYIYRMFRVTKISLIGLLAIALITFSGCVYFNTFFMAKKKFNEAEKNQREALENQNQQQGQRNAPRGSGRNAGRPGGGRNQGGQRQSKVNPQDKLLYEDVIKKAGKVLKFHPESKYVDDALWLIGKSYYNMGDYLLAERKFTELVTNHPKSKFVDDSYFYMAMSRIELENIESALRALNEIEFKFPKSGYFDDVLFTRGSISKKDKNYPGAIDQFNLYLGKYPKADSSARAYFYIGECHNELGNDFEAYQAFYLARNRNPSKKLYFDATIAAAVAAIKADSITIGMEILKKLAKDEKYFEESPKIKLRVADGYLKQGLIQEAIDEYKEVTNESPRTPESSEAYYNLGLICQNNLFDIEAAKENFNKAKSESSNSEFANLALSKSAQIAKLEAFQVQLQQADSLSSVKPNSLKPEPTDTISAIDSTEARDTTIVNIVDTIIDSLGADTTVSTDTIAEVDSISIAQTDSTIIPTDTTLVQIPGSLVNELIDTSSVSIQPPTDTTTVVDSISIVQTDSTIIPTDTTLVQIPDSLVNKPIDTSSVSIQPPTDTTTVQSNPMFEPDTTGLGTLESVTTKVNSDSIEAARVAKEDSVRQAIINDGIMTRFLLAELFAYELNQPDSALKEYLLVAGEHPTSQYAPRALLASAYIDLNRSDTLAANEVLQRILTDYPKSPQAAQAANLVGSPIDLSENAIGLYVQAENQIYYEDNPDSAILIFDYIADNFPDLAAKASLAKAWTLDQIIGVTDSSAYFAYAHVTERYPETPYSERANAKINPVSKPARRQIERRSVGDDSNGDQPDQAVLDSLKQLAQELPDAPPVMTLGDFLYPEVLLHRDLKGEVLFKIRINISGQVIDHEIIGPSGQYVIDSVATHALLETEFNTSSLEFALLDGFFKYSIPFERPEIDIFNDPYKEERERRR